MYAGVPSVTPISVSVAPSAVSRVGPPRDAEVREQRLSLGQEHVLGLEVAVDDPARVRVVERVGQLTHQTRGLGRVEGAVAVEPRAQRLARHERHDEVEQPGGLTRVEERQDVRVLQPCDEPDLAQEAVSAEGGRELREEHLDRHLALVSPVARQEDARHPAAPHFTGELVSVGEGAGRGCPPRSPPGSPPGSPEARVGSAGTSPAPAGRLTRRARGGRSRGRR
jgi:hypothetical protein